MKNISKKLVSVLISTFLVMSCARLYNGSFNQPNFPLTQPDELGPVVEKWEDGVRTSGNNNEFEWWYLDAKLEEGCGLNVVTGEAVNMVDAGIIDPVLVTKSALKNAASVVSTIISADCVISNIRVNEGS